MDTKNTDQVKLDYTLTSLQERSDLVARYLAQFDKPPTRQQCEYLSDYIFGAMPKSERKEKYILTDARLTTINKRETSYEGLVSQFETGEDGIYQIMATDTSPRYLLTIKPTITQKDIETVPGLRELQAAIAHQEELLRGAKGKTKYLLKRQLIEMRRDQYLLKMSHNQPIIAAPSPRSHMRIDLDEERYIGADGEPHYRGLISLLNPDHIAAILQNYEGLKTQTRGANRDDFYYLMEDFDALMRKSFVDYPQYLDIIRAKWDNQTNAQIGQMLRTKYGLNHCDQYISKLWREKIPKQMADVERKSYLMWNWTGPKKKCSRCQRKMPAHNAFFAKNNSAKDGWYSICKDCRKEKK